MPKLGPVWLHRVFSEKINYPWTLMSRHEREVPVNRPSGTPRPVLFPALGCRQPGGLPLPQIIKVTVKEIQLLLWSKWASRYLLRVVTIALRLDAPFAAFTDQILRPFHIENYLLTLWNTTKHFFFFNALWFLKGHPSDGWSPGCARLSLCWDEDECATLVERNRQVKTEWNMKLF